MNTHITRVSITQRETTPNGERLTIQAWCATRNCQWESELHETMHPAKAAGQRHEDHTEDAS